tara:strand:+ start:239 stop:550 length:312 start_codon:yes stop_codon:yes gene_type:complete
MSKTLRRNKTLDKAKALINGPRAEEYGDALTTHNNIATGWDIIAKNALALHGEITAGHVALMMDWVKTCRLCHTISSEDGWLDKVGYSSLGSEFSIARDTKDN